MDGPELNLLVLTDLHYAGSCPVGTVEEGRQKWLGPVLLRKAALRLQHLGLPFDAVVLLGDMIDDGLAADAENDLAELAQAAAGLKVPVLAVPGNHDGDPARYAAIFGCRPGLHAIRGYGLLAFHDPYGDGDVMTRPPEALALPQRAAADNPDLILVALQHNPLHPRIESSYPYMPTNSGAILDSYQRAGVALSLSGHYHEGQPAHDADGVTCCTVPALSEAPFQFAYVTLRGREARAQVHRLRLARNDLHDFHCHTEFAYCGTSVAADANLALAKLLGVGRQCLCEHSFQLYFDRDEAWSWRWKSDIDMVRQAWRSRSGRMDEFRRFAARYRAQGVPVGLEVDALDDGSLLLADQDREGWNYLIGGVHIISELHGRQPDQEEAERLFMRETERLLAHPIDILAHPFRFFNGRGLARPVHLYREVAQRLAAAGVAAEANFHCGRTDPRFLAACVEAGTRISLASDAHELAEVGELAPHLEALRAAGLREEDMDRVLLTSSATTGHRTR